MYMAPEINTILESHRSILQHKPSKQAEVNRSLETAFKEYRIYCRSFKRAFTPTNYSIGGLYDWGKDRIHMHFAMTDVKDSTIFVSKHDESEWSEFKFLFSQTLQHELIHRWQYIKRPINFECEVDHRFFDDISIEEEREYLMDDDEIDAYAHDIAMEIMYHYSSKNPYDVLNAIDSKRKLWSYSYYKRTFKDVPFQWARIKKKLLKKTYLWLPVTKVYI